MKLAARVGISLLLLAFLPGCSGFRGLAYLLGEEMTRDVPAEYQWLAHQKVAIIVRADAETTFEYPHVQLELADYVRVALEANVKGITVIDPRKVVDLQRGNGDWSRRDPALLGRDLGADKVLELDVVQYTTRDPESPHVYHGVIVAGANVYNTAYPDSEPAYHQEIKARYPEKDTATLGTGDREVRRGMMETFAAELAGKFYVRKVKENTP